MNKIAIPENEIKFKMLTRDDVGRVFWWKGRIFRAINKDKEKQTRELLNNGLIDELVKKNMIPKTWETNFKLNDYDLILEHEKIKRVIYPYEWSFEMLKDAAILVLKLNQISEKYGFETKDSHGYNILFDNTTPKFVDFGSFVKKEGIAWRNKQGFYENYYYNLRLWADGNQKITQSIYMNTIRLKTHEYLLLKNNFVIKIFVKIFKINKLEKIINRYWKFRIIANIDSNKIKKNIIFPIDLILIFLKNKKNIPFQKTIFTKEIKKIEKIKKTPQQNTYNLQYKKFPRFNELIKIINTTTNTSSLTDLAGNNGSFSSLVLKETDIDNITCADYDNNTIDLAYKTFKKNNLDIMPMVLNFINPSIKLHHITPNNRLKADIVSMLAVTHHLILTQRFPLEYILETIKGYANKYVIIEFMPLGLYSSKSKDNYMVPDWYTEEWFENNFKKYFKLLLKKEIEKNRIVFFGKI